MDLRGRAQKSPAGRQNRSA